VNEKNLILNLISQREATIESWKRFKSNKDREWGLFGHDMGIHPLNLMLGGWIPKKLTTIGGRSGMGKTGLTVEMFKAGGRILNNRRAEFLFFSWETGPSYLVDRHICNEVGLTLRMLNQGAKLLGEEQMAQLEAAYKQSSALPVTYQEFSTNIDTVKALGYEFVESCAKKSEIEGVEIQPVIIIDYVGMAQFEGNGLRTYGIAEFMNGMKQFCNVTGASACVFAQINRGADNKPVPDRADFSDSQSIEMASDNLLVIHRPEYVGEKTMWDPGSEKEIPSDSKMLIRVLKGRDYGIGDVVIESDVKHFRFHDINHRHDFPYWELYKSEDFWIDHFGLRKSIQQLKIV
jgi:replicative DNA helicase